MGFNRGQRRKIAQVQGIARRTTSLSIGAAAAALCGLLLAGGSSVSADTSAGYQSAPSGKTISLRLTQADIYTVISELENRANEINGSGHGRFNVAVIEGSQPYHLINVALDHVTPDQAIHYIAASAGASVALNSDGVYILQPLQSQNTQSDAQNYGMPMGAAQYGNPPSAQGSSNNGYGQSSPLSQGPVSVHKLFLKYVSPDDVLKKFGWTQDMRSDPEAAFDNPPPAFSYHSNSSPVNVIEQPLVQNYGNSQQPSVPAGQGTTGPNQANDYNQANRSANPNDTTGQAHQFGFGGGQGGFGGGGFGGGQGGFGGGQGGFGGGGFGGNVGGGGFGGGLGGGRGGQQAVTLPDGVDHIYAIEGDNSLLVFATQAGYDNIENIVRYLDVRARQVQIKVEFVTATVTDIDSFGINFSLIPTPGLAISLPTASNNPANSTGATAGNSTNGSTTGTTGSTSGTSTTGTSTGTSGGTTGSTGTSNTGIVNNPGASYLQFAYGNVAAQLYALLTKTKSKLVSAPIISTTNNVPAILQFQQIIPYTIPETTIVPNGGTVTNNQPGEEEIDTELPVDPRINGDDTVTLRLQPIISTPSGSPTSTGQVPIQTETLDATRTVRSGETMVVGGLVSKTENDSRSQVPILGSLPIIGGFFRSHYINNTDSELLIFVTPTIIDEDSDAADSGDTAQPQSEVGVNAIPGAQANPGGAVTP